MIQVTTKDGDVRQLRNELLSTQAKIKDNISEVKILTNIVTIILGLRSDVKMSSIDSIKKNCFSLVVMKKKFFIYRKS